MKNILFSISLISVIFIFNSISYGFSNENIIVIDNTPFSLPDDSGTVPLIGFRSFTSTTPATSPTPKSKYAYSISIDSIKEAALNNAEIASKLETLWGGTNNIDLDKIKNAILISDYYNDMILSKEPIFIGKQQKLVSGQLYDNSMSILTETILINPDVLLNFVSTGVIDTKKLNFSMLAE